MTHRNEQQGSIQDATRRGVISGLVWGARRSLLSVIGAAWLLVAGIVPVQAASLAYITNISDNTVSVIDTTTLTVSATVPVGASPVAFGQFIAGGTPPPPVGGAVTGVSPTQVLCENLTRKRRMSIKVPLTPGATSWDCEAAGLIVSPGDTIKQTITGIAD